MELQDRRIPGVGENANLRTVEKSHKLVIKITEENGVVYKAVLRNLLKMNKYYLNVHIKDIIEDNKNFEKDYNRYHRRPYMTFKLAKVVICHIYGLDTVVLRE